jgi:hypothetical protein
VRIMFSGHRVLRVNGSTRVVYTDHGRHLESKMAQRLAVRNGLETVEWRLDEI